jgi:monoamine oxidase
LVLRFAGIPVARSAGLDGAATGLEQFFDRAFTNFLRDALLEEGNRLDEIVGGMALLPEGLADRLQKTQVEHGTRVIAITPRAHGRLSVTVERDRQREEIDGYDAVLCTLPFTVLRRLDLASAFSKEKMAAIRDLSYASSTKVLLHCRERFWESKYDIFGGASVSDHIIRQVYYPSGTAETKVAARPAVSYMSLYSGYEYGDFGLSGNSGADAATADQQGREHGPGVLLGSYTWGEDARRLGVLSPEDRATVVKAKIARFHPEIHEEVNEGEDGHASIFWDEHSGMTGGAFSFLKPGDQQRHYENAIKLERGIFFAGEHCSLFNAWIQGALFSSLRAVEQIVSA